MNREYHKWYSERLGREMELLVFGHDGLPVIVFPTSQARFYEFEDRGMVASVGDKIENGEIQLFCVDSLDSESWYNRNVRPRWRIARQMQYEEYILDEVVPLVRAQELGRPPHQPRLQLRRLSCGEHRAASSGCVHRLSFDERRIR